MLSEQRCVATRIKPRCTSTRGDSRSLATPAGAATIPLHEQRLCDAYNTAPRTRVAIYIISRCGRRRAAPTRQRICRTFRAVTAPASTATQAVFRAVTTGCATHCATPPHCVPTPLRDFVRRSSGRGDVIHLICAARCASRCGDSTRLPCTAPMRLLAPPRQTDTRGYSSRLTYAAPLRRVCHHYTAQARAAT